jgi:hypothetical protein
VKVWRGGHRGWDFYFTADDSALVLHFDFLFDISVVSLLEA